MATQDELKEVASVIMLCSKKELSKIQNMIKFRSEQLAKELKDNLKPGDKVTVTSTKGVEHGEVIEIKRTRVKVKIKNRYWSCPLTILSLDE